MELHSSCHFYSANAQEEIYITDWWLSPELHMKRPVAKYGDEFRLDLLLQKKASLGVKVLPVVLRFCPWCYGTAYGVEVQLVELRYCLWFLL